MGDPKEDPTHQGWRLVSIDGHQAILGRINTRGCALVRTRADGCGFDVELYYDLEPHALNAQLLQGQLIADAYRHAPQSDGWALPLIRELEAKR